MNARVHPEVLICAKPHPELSGRSEASDTVAHQMPLSLATAGVQRYVWNSRYGQMLIEVVQGQVFVNGKQVEPAQEPPA